MSGITEPSRAVFKGKGLLLLGVLYLGVMLTAGSCAWSALSPVEVKVRMGEETTMIKFRGSIVAQILAMAQENGGEGDKGTAIQENWARPVQVTVEGRTKTVMVPLSLEKKILASAGIPLGEEDRIELRQEETGPLTLRIYRVTKETVVTEEEIPSPTETRPDSDLPQGQSRTQPGEPGLARLTYQVIYEDGQEKARKLVSREVVREPKTTVLVYGVKGVPGPLWGQGYQTPSRGLGYKKVLSTVATAYTHTGNPTATGIYPRVGVVAVDPKVIPLGSRLYVEGYGYALAADTGGAIKGHRIDVFMESREECLQWGRKGVKVYILE